MSELLSEMKGWPRERYQAILENPNETGERQAVARVWWHATSAELNAAGSPIAGAEFDRICDRTGGKPKQAMEHSGTVQFGQITLDGDKEIHGEE